MRELLRPATRTDLLQLLCFGSWLLALVVTLRNILVTSLDFMNGNAIPWAKVGSIQVVAILFYVAYLYLRRAVTRSDT